MVTVTPDEIGRAITISGRELEVAQALLEKGPMGRQAIGRKLSAGGLGVSNEYAGVLCQSLMKKGAVELVGGKYDLVASVREALEARR